MARGSEGGFGKIGGGKIGDVAIRDEDVAVGGSIGGGVVVAKIKGGARDGGVDTEFLKNF